MNTMAAHRALVTGLIVGLVGCAPTGQPVAPATAGPAQSSEPAATQPASPSASPTAASPALALPELLPDSLDRVELHTFAVGGDILDRLASTLRVEPTAIEAAYASEHGARFFQSYAIRVPGVGGSRLLEAFAASAYDPSEGEVTAHEASVGGRSVTVVTQSATAARLGTFYAYVMGDVLLVVQAFDPVVADEVIRALP